MSSEPLRLWEASKGTQPADFTTRFSFRIDIFDGKTDDGLAFYLAPVGYPIPPDSAGAYFGLLNSTTVSDVSRNQIVMVEFDSYPNAPPATWDPQEQHVGINLNSIASVAYAGWDATANSGKTADVCLSYNATTMNLTVAWSYEEAGADPASKSGGFVSYVVDLRTILPELVSVGISAATGLDSEEHVVSSWEFRSSLELDIPNNDNDKKIKKRNWKLIFGGNSNTGYPGLCLRFNAVVLVREKEQMFEERNFSCLR